MNKVVVIRKEDVERFLSADAQERFEGYINLIESSKVRLGEIIEVTDEDVVVIPRKRLQGLVKDSNKLCALKSAGAVTGLLFFASVAIVGTIMEIL